MRVSEKIVKALSLVNCEIEVEPHQIQGMDTKAIYEITRWAVKRLLETRDSRNFATKSGCKAYYQKPLHIPAEKRELISKAKVLEHNGRDFKIKNTFALKSTEQLKILFNCIEYSQNKEKGFQRNFLELLRHKNLLAEPSKLERKNTTTLSGEEREVVAKVMSEAIEQAKEAIDNNALNEIFMENLDKIAKEVQSYENEESRSKVDKLTLLGNEKKRLGGMLLTTLNRIAEIESDIQSKQRLTEKVENEISELALKVAESKESLEKNEKRLKKSDEKISELASSKEIQELVEEKVKDREDYKTSIKEFKQRCKDEQEKLEKELAQLEKQSKKLEEKENIKTFDEIDSFYSKEFSNLNAKKKDLSEENKEITSLTRKIQLTPSRLEMLQYQKRFQELYNEINKISELNKKYIADFNNKTEIIELFEQKLDMFKQVANAYKNLTSKEDKLDFKNTLSEIVKNVGDSITQVVQRNKKLINENEDLSAELKILQGKESIYLKLVKEYNKEYLLNKNA